MGLRCTLLIDKTMTNAILSFLGVMNDDFKTLVYQDSEAIDNTYMVTGLSSSILSARVSYVYNLLGPAITVDTACSSSLVAVDLGCQALRTGNSNNY